MITDYYRASRQDEHPRIPSLTRSAASLSGGLIHTGIPDLRVLQLCGFVREEGGGGVTDFTGDSGNFYG